MNSLTQILKATDFAAKKHKRQKRKGANGEPYINHPIEVARLLIEDGKIDDCEVLVAAILHDTIEDTETSEAEITELFGERVCGFVREVTDDKTLSKAERKELQIAHAPHLSDGAKQIKIADKISNIEDIAEDPPESWSVERRLEYIDWSENVIAGLRGINQGLEELFNVVAEKARNLLSAEK